MTMTNGTNGLRRRAIRGRHRRFAGSLLAAAMLVGACSSNGGADRAHSTTTVGSKGSAAVSAGKEWAAYGHDLSNTRTNASETKINVITVSRLTKSWENDGLVGVSGTPAIASGIAYFGDWKGTMRAVKAVTGEEVWNTPIPGGFIV